MIKGTHFSVIPRSNDNAGDNLLYSAMRFLFSKYCSFSIQWDIDSQWSPSSAEYINKKHSDFALFGGGGLFLPDQKGANYSNKTGWQINLSKNDYHNINMPYFFASVGYNWFRASLDDPNIIIPSANACINNSSVFGMRNYGSINKIKEIVAPKKEIEWTPCPTTLLSSIGYGESKSKKIHYRRCDSFDLAKSKIGVNLSCDRLAQRRIGEKDFTKLRLVFSYLRDLGANICFIAHKRDDLFAYETIGRSYFDGYVLFSQLDITSLISEYQSYDVVLGGRGHSLMIPVGLNIPIISITTHDKQRFFIQDFLPLKYNIELGELSDVEILDRIVNCIKSIEEQFNLIDSYQAKALSAWLSYIHKFESFFV